MRVESLVRRPPVTISSGATIKQAAEVFAREKIGLLVVASSIAPIRAEAVLSERDIVRAVAAGVPSTQKLDSMATTELIGVQRSDPLSKAARLMMENNVRHLLVLNGDGSLFGVLSIRDFLREQKVLQGFLRDESEESHGID